jgi:hypothetical protein
MKLFTLILVTIVSVMAQVNTANAENVPNGCYVTDAERNGVGTAFGYTPQCYRPVDGYLSWKAHNNYSRDQILTFYGSFVEGVIFANYEEILRCSNGYDALAIDFHSLFSVYKTQAAREKKLRKACGLKCRKVK